MQALQVKLINFFEVQGSVKVSDLARAQLTTSEKLDRADTVQIGRLLKVLGNQFCYKTAKLFK